MALKVVSPTDAPAPTTEIPDSPPLRRLTAKPLRNVDTHSSHPVSGMTMDALLSYYRAAEQGTPVFQFDLFDDYVERIGHLRGLLDGRNQSVAGKDWVLVPGRENHPASAKAAADLELVLKNDLGFREFLEHQNTAPGYGVAATNLMWDLTNDSIIAPVRFVNVAHRRLGAPSYDRAGEIHLLAGDSKFEMLPLEPGSWAVSRYRHRNPWAAGLLRTACIWAMFETWSIKNWQSFGDMFGIPTVVGYYEDDASETARLELVEAVKRIGQDGWSVLSKQTQILIEQAARSGDATSVYPAIASWCEAQMSKAINGSTLTTDVGGKGSYALGAVHENRQYALQLADARRLEEMFTRDIGRPFVLWNGYPNAAPPRLKMHINRETSLLERAEVLSIIGQVLELDEDQVREEFALRTPAAGRGVKFPTKSGDPAKAKLPQGGDA